VCTVVVRWDGSSPAEILALRDELTTRAFDDPDRWWPEYPDVVGGHDVQAGGTWCATNISSGVTALVLNRPNKRMAAAGAPSRGVLPLLGCVHEFSWLDHVALDGMASFALVLVDSSRVATWVYDGAKVVRTDHEPGTFMVTSGGAEDGKAGRFLAEFEAARFPNGWQTIVEQQRPADDPAALVVRHENAGLVYGTVFGELIDASPGRLQLQFSRTPWESETWRTTEFRRNS
jgi:hypothetical protein